MKCLYAMSVWNAFMKCMTKTSDKCRLKYLNESVANCKAGSFNRETIFCKNKSWQFEKIIQKQFFFHNLTFCPLSSTQSANLEQFEIWKNEIKDQFKRITSLCQKLLHQKPRKWLTNKRTD
jgi:hypothetical protein